MEGDTPPFTGRSADAYRGAGPAHHTAGRTRTRAAALRQLHLVRTGGKRARSAHRGVVIRVPCLPASLRAPSHTRAQSPSPSNTGREPPGGQAPFQTLRHLPFPATFTRVPSGIPPSHLILHPSLLVPHRGSCCRWWSGGLWACASYSGKTYFAFAGYFQIRSHK